MTPSPLGRFSDLVAALTAAALVASAILAHMGVVVVADTAWLDTSAGLAIGVILGQRATTNGAGKIAQAAHTRLDAVHAPSAEVAAEVLHAEANGG